MIRSNFTEGLQTPGRAGLACATSLLMLSAWVVWPARCPGAGVPEGEDPFCGTPNRSETVQAVRAEMAQRLRQERRQGRSLQDVAPAQLDLSWDTNAHRPLMILRGAVGQTLQVDSTLSLSPANWQPWLTVSLDNTRQEWLEAWPGANATRFYRSIRGLDAALLDMADDFLLLDHEGKAHELFYATDLKALVIATAGDSPDQVGPALAAFQALAQTAAADGVQFWLLWNEAGAERTNVAARVQAVGASFPALLDPHGIGLEALRLTHAGEMVVVQPPGFAIVYRGQLEWGRGGSGNSAYLSAALSSIAQGQSPKFLRTPVTGPGLAVSAGATPSYSGEIAPIFHDRCAICHRDGDVAPFAFTNYSVAAERAPVIKHMLLTGQMPPWHADPEYGQWTNSLALPAKEKARLLRWIDAGAPRGTGGDPLAELPPPPAYRAWPAELGPPDALVTVGLQPIKATGVEPYRYLYVQSPNPSNVWLRAAIILPSNPRSVHHYLVWTGRIGNRGFGNVSTYQEGLAGYAPGVAPYLYPPDSGYFLQTSNWLTFNLHYTPNGLATNDLPMLALWYHRSQPPKNYRVAGIANPFFLIQPRDPESPVQAQFTFSRAVRLHRLNPHMHLRGKHARFEALYPDGTTELLLSVPDYNFRWQTGYEFAEPKSVPAGTQILVTGAFDNSPQNLANPDPNATVTWGDQTTNEMFVGFVDYVE